MIVPFPAGGGSDILARIVAERMKAALGQPVIIENVGGAGGTIGTARVARAAPDGYTIGFGQWSSHVGSGALYPLTFDLLKDLTPVARLTEARLWIIGRSRSAGAKSEGADRLAQGQSGQGHGGNDRRGQRHPALLHRLSEQHRHQVPARALPGRGADHAGPAGRPDRSDLPGGRTDAGALPQRQDQGLCGDGNDALVRGAGGADHRRSRRAGTAHDVLVRPVGAGRHAARMSSPSSTPRWSTPLPIRRSARGLPNRATIFCRARSSRRRRSARTTRPRSRNGGRSSRRPASSCNDCWNAWPMRSMTWQG